MISVIGGIINLATGVTIAFLVVSMIDIPTIISAISILLLFIVAATVALLFGISLVKRAASQDQIVSLRHE